MKHFTLSVLAHVDAGKTTLGERFLYRAGIIRTLGRVDHGSAHLDADTQERERGITVYSAQARLVINERGITLIDTPGHVDFQAEMMNALAVTDVAVLVISARDGVQGHTRTIWRKLAELSIPTFIFINKTDLPGFSHAELMDDLKTLDQNAYFEDFSAFQGGIAAELLEPLVLRDDALLEAYLADTLDDGMFLQSVRTLFKKRKLFPILKGSALHGDGVDPLIDCLTTLAPERVFDPCAPASGEVFRITQDASGTRVAVGRLYSGRLRARDTVGDDKIHRLYAIDGGKFTPVQEILPGEVFAATGLSLRAGDVFGNRKKTALALPVPTISAKVNTGAAVTDVLKALAVIADEGASMRYVREEDINQTRVLVCGTVQLEILKSRLLTQFGIEAIFSDPDVVYLEKPAQRVIGRGHYEPLRHYAEVHLRLTPAPPNSGITFSSEMHVDSLPAAWQNLVRTHVLERVPRGPTIGAPIGDMHITLVAARMHKEHTSGGDFREATYRAIRHGLLKSGTVIQEPYTRFYISVPTEYMGRVVGELSARGASISPDIRGEIAHLEGRAQTARMMDVSKALLSLSRGAASVTLAHDGYEPVRDPAPIIEKIGYNPLRDPLETGDSIFCGHGAGFTVPWEEADRYMHIPATES